MEEWSTGSRCAGGQGPGAAYLRRTQAQGTGLLPPTPPRPVPPLTCGQRGGMGRAGDKAQGKSGGPLGLFRWLSDPAPCVAGPMGYRAAHTEPPPCAPLVGGDITPVSTPRSRQLPARLYGAGPDPPGPPPHAPHTATHWPTVLGSGGQGPPRHLGTACPCTHSTGLASTSSSLWERPVDLEGTEPPLGWVSGPARQNGLLWVPSNMGQAPTDLGEARRGHPFPAPSAGRHPSWECGPLVRGQGSEIRHGDTLPTQPRDIPGSGTSGAPSGVGGAGLLPAAKPRQPPVSRKVVGGLGRRQGNTWPGNLVS